MSLFMDIGQGAGLSGASGVRPFLPALLAGGLARGDTGLDFDGTSFSFLESPYFLLAVLVVGVIALFFGVNMALEALKGPAAPTATPSVATGVTPLPNPAAQSSPPPFLMPSPSPSPTLAPPQQRTHTVEGGDTLNRIAQRYGVTVETIMQANGFTDRNRILRIGERLVIPDSPPASPAPVPR
jgi:LysM repeat protein